MRLPHPRNLSHSRPITRRNLFRTLGGTMAVAPFLQGFAAGPAEAAPKRFVFVLRSNGLLPTEIQPVERAGQVRARNNGAWNRKLHTEALDALTLSEGMRALNAFKDRLTIFQGLSGRMADGSHSAGFGALGAYKGSNGPPALPTIDGRLAGLLDSPFPHIGFAMETVGTQVVYPNLFAAGAGKPLPCYADPVSAYGDLFGSVVSDKKLKAALQVDQNLLDFMVGDVARFQKTLPASEREKLGHYLDGFEALRVRAKRLATMEDELRAAAPAFGETFRSEIETERLDAHFELATAALIGGLTSVIAIRADHLRMRLTGLGLGSKTVHQMGHMIEGQKGGAGGQAFENGWGEFDARRVVLDYHMRHLATMAGKLAAVPEGDGSMLDNTVILYLSDHGERHHSKCYEWPMVALGNLGGAFKAGRLIHVPGWSEAGHRTIGHLYNSLLHGAGHPQKRFGQPDLSLPESIGQTGPLAEWMA